MNKILQDYLDEVRRQVRHLSYPEQDLVLRDVQAHLEEEVKSLRKDKGLSEDEAALRATSRFGEPKELGVAYGPRGGIVRKSTGEVVLRVAVLTGRGLRTTVRGTLKWTGIALASLLGVILVLAVVGLFVAKDLAVAYKDEVHQNLPHPLYSYHGSWSVPDAQNGITNDQFEPEPGMRSFTMALRVDAGTGCVAIQLIDPAGNAQAVNGQGCGDFQKELTFAKGGLWRVTYTFAGFTGAVQVDAMQFLQ